LSEGAPRNFNTTTNKKTIIIIIIISAGAPWTICRAWEESVNWSGTRILILQQKKIYITIVTGAPRTISRVWEE
jgi:hypothetical protein